MVTNAELMQRYHEFNKKFFGNKLPKDMVVEFATSRTWMGITHFRRGRPLYIQLDKKMRLCVRTCMLTLLHEMVHVEQPETNHGKKFHARMLKLARQGAMKAWW